MTTDVITGLRILHVSTMAEVIVHFKLPLLDMLAKAGAKQSIYCSDEQYCGSRDDSYCEGGHLKILIELGYEIIVGPITRRPSLRTLYEIWVLSRHIRKTGYDLVIAHQPVAALVGMPASALAGSPIRIYFSGGLRTVTLSDRIINRYGEHLMVLLSNATMLNNLEDLEHVRNLWGGSGKARFAGAMEGCGVDTDETSPDKRLAARPGIRRHLLVRDSDYVISYAGRLVWEKGIGELIEAVARLSRALPEHNIRCLIIGIGPDMDEMKRMVEKTGLTERFIFAGYRFDIERYLSASDIFVLPSYREGLPTVLLQAMAMGLPCIATDIRGSRELISDGINGLIVPPRDPEGLAGAVSTLLKDSALAEGIAREARITVEKRYARCTLLPRTVDTIREIVEESRK